MFGTDKLDWDKLSESEKILRKLLWLNHGHIELYGDDGEMQCSRCMIDFKRDTTEVIKQIFSKQAQKRFEDWSKEHVVG